MDKIKLPKIILFVCTGNSCRSVMAKEIFRKMLDEAGKKNIKVASAGTAALTGMKPPREVEEVMKKEEVDVSHYEATCLTVDLIEEANLILVMDGGHQQTVLEMSPGASEKTFLLKEFSAVPQEKHLGISDPIGAPLLVYREVLGEIKSCLQGLLRKLDSFLG